LPADRSVLLALRSGALLLQGLDLLVDDVQTQRADRLAAVGLVPGSELTLADCTVTLTVSRPGSAIFAVLPPPGTPNPDSQQQASRVAVVRMRDSFLRSSGDGFAVASGRRLELELTNVLAATEASLLHAFGGSRQRRTDLPTLRIRLDQVSMRVKGGLLHLDSSSDDPELATATVVAQNCIMSTANHDDPLLRLDGRDQLEDLGDKVRWEGHNVAYDRIKTYRRDEVARTGVVPRVYDRANWTSAFLPRDDSPSLEVQFLRAVDPSQAAWKLERDDFRLAPSSPGGGNGPDLSRIPQPPPANAP
jgi:serine/threonine-protein kinase